MSKMQRFTAGNKFIKRYGKIKPDNSESKGY
jgi:hypothetical protein